MRAVLGQKLPDGSGSFATGIFSRIARLYHTIKPLKAIQIFGRLRFRLIRPRPDLRPAPMRRKLEGMWTTPPFARQSLIGPRNFYLLNQDVSVKPGWAAPEISHLLHYHLHSFEDLTAQSSFQRVDWHRALIENWCRENPPTKTIGWEPHPLSLRIGNWVKWELGGTRLSPRAFHNLAVQGRHLARRVEHHLQGNHLIANAKGLIFWACFFGGEEPDRILREASSLLMEELRKQILPDGGHFELSPLYHALALEDLLDILNLAKAYPDTIDKRLIAKITKLVPKMLRWLQLMSHPDGEISFFNDAAIGVAKPHARLQSYALRLGLTIPLEDEQAVTHLAASGYIRAETKGLVALIDAAPVGPNYQPGHAHADSLSFELSLRGERVIVNSGTSLYARSKERLRQRGTSAHNCLLVEGKNSSDIWSSFRVGRRANIELVTIQLGPKIQIGAAHDGYAELSDAPIHYRIFEMEEDRLCIRDQLSGPLRSAEARFHFAPNITLETEDGLILRDGKPLLSFVCAGAAPHIEMTSHHPEFGLSLASQCLVVPMVNNQASIAFTVLAERAELVRAWRRDASEAA